MARFTALVCWAALAALAVLAHPSLAAGSAMDAEIDAAFSAFLLQHRSRELSSGRYDAAFRRQVFARNYRHVAALNAETASSPGGGALLSATKFSDMTREEIAARTRMRRRPCAADPLAMHRASRNAHPAVRAAVAARDAALSALPASVDWRTTGVVTSVKDQGSVGTCWAFSTVGNVEGQFAIAGNMTQAVDLSPEFLTDCDSNDCGVFGGWPYLAFQFVIATGGLPTEQAYPYCSGTGDCYPCMANTSAACGPGPEYCNKTWNPQHCPTTARTAKISSWFAVPVNESAIAGQLAATGPLSVLLDATGLEFYQNGVWDPAPGPFSCGNTPDMLDHAVLLVGYGTDAGKDYWIVKNSWGKDWGESGYFRIARGKNTCGIALGATTSVI